MSTYVTDLVSKIEEMSISLGESAIDGKKSIHETRRELRAIDEVRQPLLDYIACLEEEVGNGFCEKTLDDLGIDV